MIPVLSLLVGVAATCWVIGGTSITATRMKRVRNWGWGLLFSLVGFWLFLALLPPPSDLVAVRRTVDDNSPELPWEAYTPDCCSSIARRAAPCWSISPPIGA
jgi:hypothetical protein